MGSSLGFSLFFGGLPRFFRLGRARTESLATDSMCAWEGGVWEGKISRILLLVMRDELARTVFWISKVSILKSYVFVLKVSFYFYF